MNITKEQIKEWVKSTANLDDEAIAYNLKIEEQVDLNLVGMIEQCIQDLGFGWISIYERLPNGDSCDLLVCLESGEQTIGHFYNGEWSDDHCGFTDDPVVYWMEWPKPPKPNPYDK